jgi:hypothetical protein
LEEPRSFLANELLSTQSEATVVPAVYAIIAVSILGFAFLAVTSPPAERRNHLAQLFCALFVAAVFLIIVPSG